MIAITGITGNVGGEVARRLLAANQPVRAVVRDIGKGAAWANCGCDVVSADINDALALTAAFQGAEGVFVLVPPNFDPSPDFREARAIGTALKSALDAARPGNVVYLSTIGAQAARSNLLTQHTLIEQVLGELPVPITFLRPGWFMENASWDVAPATHSGVVPSFLQPLDKPVPMVATGRHWPCRRRAPAGNVEGRPSGRIGGTSSGNPERNRRHLRHFAPPPGENGSRAARDLGTALQIAGHEQPHASNSDARWLQ